MLAQRPGRTAIRYSCTWVKDSRMDFATRFRGSAVQQAPSGPTYTALVQDMPSILGALDGQRQWEAKVDVPSRYLEVTVWPLTAETTEAVIAAGRVDVALSCLPGTVAPDPSVVSVQR